MTAPRGRPFSSLTITAVLGAASLVLGGWVVMALVHRERAFDAVLWAAEHSPLELTAPPLEIANAAVNSLAQIGAAGSRCSAR